MAAIRSDWYCSYKACNDFFPGLGHQFSHPSIMLDAVGHDQQFVPRVKSDEFASGLFFVQAGPPSLQDKNRLDEVFPKLGVVQAAFLFHRISGKWSMKARAKRPTPVSTGIPFSLYTLTRAIPLLGDRLLKIKPHRFSSSSSRTRLFATSSSALSRPGWTLWSPDAARRGHLRGAWSPWNAESGLHLRHTGTNST